MGYLTPWLSPQTHLSLLNAYSLEPAKEWDKGATPRHAGCTPQRCLCIICEPKSNDFCFFPWLESDSTGLFWNLPKADRPRTYNCREGLSFLAVVSVCAGCKRQYGPSSRFSARRADVWTQCYHYTNIVPVLPRCFTIASTGLSVPPLFLLVVRRAILTYLYKYKYLYRYLWRQIEQSEWNKS